MLKYMDDPEAVKGSLSSAHLTHPIHVWQLPREFNCKGGGPALTASWEKENFVAKQESLLTRTRLMLKRIHLGGPRTYIVR